MSGMTSFSQQFMRYTENADPLLKVAMVVLFILLMAFSGVAVKYANTINSEALRGISATNLSLLSILLVMIILMFMRMGYNSFIAIVMGLLLVVLVATLYFQSVLALGIVSADKTENTHDRNFVLAMSITVLLLSLLACYHGLYEILY